LISYWLRIYAKMRGKGYAFAYGMWYAASWLGQPYKTSRRLLAEEASCVFGAGRRQPTAEYCRASLPGWYVGVSTELRHFGSRHWDTLFFAFTSCRLRRKARLPVFAGPYWSRQPLLRQAGYVVEANYQMSQLSASGHQRRPHSRVTVRLHRATNINTTASRDWQAHTIIDSRHNDYQQVTKAEGHRVTKYLRGHRHNIYTADREASQEMNGPGSERNSTLPHKYTTTEWSRKYQISQQKVSSQGQGWRYR